MRTAYYVDLVRNRRQFTLLAGPFVSETIARRYEVPAFEAAMGLDPRCAFDTYGVVAVRNFQVPGLVNDRLAIDAADLVAAN